MLFYFKEGLILKSKEIKAKIEAENRSLMDLIEKEDLEGAKAKKVEIRKLMDDLEKAEKEEKQEEEKSRYSSYRI